jgi:hypothetical protein
MEHLYLLTVTSLCVADAQQGSTAAETGVSSELEELQVPSERPEPEVPDLDVCVRTSLEDWQRKIAKIRRHQEEFAGAYRATISIEDKKERLGTELKRQRDIIDRLITDFDYTSAKLNDHLPGVKGLTENMRAKREQALSDVPAAIVSALNAIAEMETLHRKFIASPGVPGEGSAAYFEWHKSKLNLQIQFAKERASYRRHLRQSVLHRAVGEMLSEAADRVMQWSTLMVKISEQLNILSRRGRGVMERLDTDDPHASTKLVEAFVEECDRVLASFSANSALTIVPSQFPPSLRFDYSPTIEDFDVVVLLRGIATQFRENVADGADAE